MPFDLAAALPLLLPRAIAWSDANAKGVIGSGALSILTGLYHFSWFIL